MRAFVMCDGEEAQISVFQELEIRNLLQQAGIDFGKTPASCSAILQSSDVSIFFKLTKQVLKTIHQQPYRRDHLTRNLKTAFIHYRQRNGDSTICNLSSAVETKIIDALQQISYAIHKTLNPDVIIKGYIECGQDGPLSLNSSGQETYEKYDKCISKCTRSLTNAECQVMRENFPYFVGIMRQRGKITEAEMDEKGIPNYNCHDSDNKPKDQRALHKQRATVMNSDDVISQFIDYQQLRINRQLELEQRRAFRDATVEQRQANKTAKEAEKRRRESMTADEKREEANAKRRVTLARKRLEQQQDHGLQHQILPHVGIANRLAVEQQNDTGASDLDGSDGDNSRDSGDADGASELFFDSYEELNEENIEQFL